MELRSLECVVRTFRLDDAASLARHGNNRRIWKNLRDRFPHPFSEADGAQYIGSVLSDPSKLSYAIEVDGEAAGGISLHPGQDVERVSAEIGYWVGESHWGRGVATAAIRLLTDRALLSPIAGAGIELLRVFAVPFASNPASCRALEKAGYQREGLMRKSAIKDGKILDQQLYAKIRE